VGVFGSSTGIAGGGLRVTGPKWEGFNGGAGGRCSALVLRREGVLERGQSSRRGCYSFTFRIVVGLRALVGHWRSVRLDCSY
jgi:hypothetical protein